jgi:preprotein translocase subunit SecF
MEFFSHTTKIDFMGLRYHAYCFSSLIFLVSVVSFLYFGLNLGLDFTGGTQTVLNFEHPVSVSEVRSSLDENNMPYTSIQSYGSSKSILMRFGSNLNLNKELIKGNINTVFPEAKVVKMTFIGPQMGKEMMVNGFMAMIVSMLITMLYIALRFEYRFAVAAILSLVHDPVLIIGTFALFGLEFNLISLAALLTILGYSLNDTIVVYDRIRENYRKYQKMDSVEAVNVAINQTLSRTIMTSGLTFLVVFALMVYGGDTLFGFSVALAIGIIIGTYSSIYIAGAIALTLGFDKTSLFPKRDQHIYRGP